MGLTSKNFSMLILIFVLASASAFKSKKKKENETFHWNRLSVEPHVRAGRTRKLRIFFFLK